MSAPLYVIHRKYLPPRPPILLGIVLWLLLDRLHAVGWVEGVVWTVYAFWFVLMAVGFWISKDVHPSKIPERP